MPDDVNLSQRPQTASPNGTGTGEGIDRKIEQKTFTPKRIALGAGLLLAFGVLGYLLWTVSTGGQRLAVERERLTISTAERGPFQEFIAVTGTVLPENTVYLDAAEGGRVEEVYVESGAMVEAGDPLVRLSNSDLQLRLMQNEARLTEQVSNLQQMRFQVEQSRLSLRQQLIEMDYQITRLAQEHARNEQLYEKGLIAEQEYERTRDELAYQRSRKELTQRAYGQDSLAQANRLGQMAASLRRQNRSFDTLQATLANLTIRAPIGGQLTALDAQVGEIRPPGSRFGQIDVLDSFKVRAQIDEFYIARVQPGQTATTEAIGGGRYAMEVTRVYPEVTDGRFQVDLIFTGAAPGSIRRGQSVRLRLELGSPEEALLLARGGFYQSTGGNWAYVLTGEGEAARRPVELGRQNPGHFEVLGGLQPGDEVVTSSYETFGQADVLVLE